MSSSKQTPRATAAANAPTFVLEAWDGEAVSDRLVAED
jgi:hypothetical protein